MKPKVKKLKKTARPISPIMGTVYTVIGAVAFVAIWWIAAAAYKKELVFPSPANALARLIEELSSVYFWRAFGNSLLRSHIGFISAVFLSLLCAYLGALLPQLRKILSPVIGILRSLPTMSVILLFVLWVRSEVTPVLVSGLVIFPTLYSAIDAGLCAVPRDLLETATLYAGNRSYTFFVAELPMAAPYYLRVAGGAASLTLKLTVAAEVLAQTRESIGLMMQQTRISFDIGRLMALTVAVVVAALIIEFAVYLIRRAVDYD